MFHILVDGQFTFMCLTDITFDRKIAFAFLFEVKTRFFSRFEIESSDSLSMSAFSLNSQFSTVLANQMEYFSSNPAQDKIEHVRNQLRATKTQLVENIDKLIHRGEHTTLIVGQTTSLTEQANRFTSNSKDIQWKLKKQNMIQLAMLVTLGGIVLWLVLSLFCGLSLRRC